MVYTEENKLQLCVSAEVVDPRLGTRDLTNVFYFTFSTKEPVKKVLPQTYHGETDLSKLTFPRKSSCTWHVPRARAFMSRRVKISGFG